MLLVGHRVAKMRQLRAACAAQGATCLFSWSSYTNPFGLALLGTGIRRVGSYRNAMFADLPTRLRSVWAWASLAGISAAVCNSRDTFEQLSSRRALRPKATYVPNGVEAPSPSEVAALRAQWRSRLGLQEDTVLIMGAVSYTHLDVYKRQPSHLRTCNILSGIICQSPHGHIAKSNL